MPDPKQYKSKEDFMKVCILQLVNEGKPQDQAVVACSSMWDSQGAQISEPKKPKSKLELLSEFKKQLEKNGYSLEDEKLESLLQHIGLTGNLPQLDRFSNSVKLDKSAPVQIIQVFPKKKCYFEKYDKYVDFNDELFDQMILNFNNPKLFKPYMDVDHKLEEKNADILDLFKKPDGLYAKIQLNDLGLENIKNNKYSYISPEWGPRTDTEKKLHNNVLWAVTLTNIPAFEGELPKLQEQMKLTKKKGNIMLNTRLMKLASEMDKLNFKNTIKLADTPEDTQSNPIDPAIIEEAIMMINDLSMKLKEAIGQKEQAEEQVQEMTKKAEEKEMNTFIEEAIKCGKIEAKDQEIYIKLWKTNKEDVKALIDSKPENTQQRLSLSAKQDSQGLEKNDYEIMDKQGYRNPDGSYDIVRYKKAIGG
jgi:hypothetical protein